MHPINKAETFSKNKLLKNNNNSNVINLIFPGNKSGSSIFKLNEKILHKLIPIKNGNSYKNINIQRIPIIKENNSMKKIIIKSNSEKKSFFKKINLKKKKGKNFNTQIDTKYINNGSFNENYLKTENISKFKINLNANSFRTSRKISLNDNHNKLINTKKNRNNIIISLSKNNIKIKTNKPYLVKTERNLIPKFQTKINLKLYDNKIPKKNSYHLIGKAKLIDKNIQNKTFLNLSTNIQDKENINSSNLINLTEINGNENLLFSRVKKSQKRKINLPFCPTSNKDKSYMQIKLKKYYLRNNENDIFIPYNEKTKFIRQYSYYNQNLNNKYKNKRNQKINSNLKDDGCSFSEMDISNKNYNLINSYELPTKANANSFFYDNNELSGVSKEINISYEACNEMYGVEMNHFRIVKIIQENKNMLNKNEKNL